MVTGKGLEVKTRPLMVTAKADGWEIRPYLAESGGVTPHYADCCTERCGLLTCERFSASPMNEAQPVPDNSRYKLLRRWGFFAVLHRIVAVGCFFLAFLEGMASFTRSNYSHFWTSLFCYLDFPVVLLMRYGFKRPLMDTPKDLSEYWTFPNHAPLDGVAVLWSIVVGFAIAALWLPVSRWLNTPYPPTPTPKP